MHIDLLLYPAKFSHKCTLKGLNNGLMQSTLKS
ncbi:unnamed protein product [Chironomus riparius]|uniref:Uncharacterized protein n=1 Tax=Chironomus riparius TaxID=315576 RepID=A0A9N9S438_9DIPT|nr:unnamed protein product [Chironomus riparius]